MFPKLIKFQKPDSTLKISSVDKDVASSLEFELKINGYVNIIAEPNEAQINISCKTPSYEIGSVNKLNLQPKPAANVWKLDDTLDDDVIDADDLLDEEDLKKPDPTTLKG